MTPIIRMLLRQIRLKCSCGGGAGDNQLQSALETIKHEHFMLDVDDVPV